MGVFSFDFSGMACAVFAEDAAKPGLSKTTLLFLSGAAGDGKAAACPHVPYLCVPVSTAALNTFPADRVSVFHLPGGDLWYMLRVDGFEIQTSSGLPQRVDTRLRRGLASNKDFENLDSVLNLTVISGGVKVDPKFLTSDLGSSEVIAARFLPSGGSVEGGQPSPFCGEAIWRHPSWEPGGVKTYIDLNDRLRWTCITPTDTLTLRLASTSTYEIHLTAPGGRTAVLASMYSLCNKAKGGSASSMEDVFLYNRILVGGSDNPAGPITVVPEPDIPGEATVGDPTCPIVQGD